MHTQCSIFNVHINGKKGQLPVFKQSNIWNSCGRWILLFANASGLYLVRHMYVYISLSSSSSWKTLPSSSWSSLENHHQHVRESPLSWMEDLAPPAVTVNPQLLKGWNQSLKERTHSILYSAHCITHIVRGVKPIIESTHTYYTLLNEHCSAHCIMHIVRGAKPMIGAHEHAE